MINGHRFSLNENGSIVDKLHPTDKAEPVWWGIEEPKDEMSLRECVLGRRLSNLVDGLIIITNPMEGPHTGDGYQPWCKNRFSLWRALYGAIRASHLNTIHVMHTNQHPSDGQLTRDKIGMQDFTSLSLFVDDVERLLRDLYGELNTEAIDRVRRAVFTIVEEFTQHLRTDLWQEHQDAVNIDYVCGIGVPETCGIHGHDHSRAFKAENDLVLRACAVRSNPMAFSKYTVEFVKVLDKAWSLQAADQHEEPAATDTDAGFNARLKALLDTSNASDLKASSEVGVQ